MKNSFLVLILSLFLTTSAFAQVGVGDKAPGFTLAALEDGSEVSLSDFDGKVIYLFFYGAGCPHCQDNGPFTETDIYQPYMDNPNFVALGLDTWNYSRSANDNFKSLTGITYPLLLNAKQSLVDYYGNTSSYDRSVVIAVDGKVAYKGSDWVDSDIDQVTTTIEEQLSKVSTSSEPSENIPTTITLQQNYPNPFNPSTVITYTLNEATQVSLKVFNMLGAEVATVVNERQSAGEKKVTWNATESSGSALPSGLYIYQLKAGGDVITKKMTLIK
jgi:peroxiredoxin